MSADNYLRIFLCDDGKYRGYMGCASNDETDDELRRKKPMFVADSKDQARDMADMDYYEYGYSFAHSFTESKR